MIFLHRITHGFSRNLVAGQWLAHKVFPCCFFCHADFADDADFFSWEFFCPTDFTDFHRFFMESLMNRFVQSQGDICNDRTGRLREIPCRPMMKKICVICEICVTKKTSQEKSVYICEICGTFYNLRGYLQRPNRSPPRKSVSNRFSRKPPNKFRVIR